MVNAASNKAGPISPNTIVSMYGSDLAYITKGITPDDLRGNVLPTSLAGSGVRLLVGKLNAYIYFVSPGQINFLVPGSLAPGTVDVQLGLDSRYGPTVRLPLGRASPALFQKSNSDFAIATRADGSVLLEGDSALPGDIVILYATGLGPTEAFIPDGQVAPEANRVARFRDFRVRLDGKELDTNNTLYVGLAPGFAGLYQINLKLPMEVGPNPEIRIGFAGEEPSPASVKLPVRVE
jgi:uncharacterized protein (TIGR03437 family)